MSKKNVNAKDFTTKEIIDLNDIFALNPQQTKAVLEKLTRTANQRLTRLQKNKITSPALLSRSEGKGRKMTIKRFSTKGLKDVNKMRQKLRDVRDFLKSKTSTVRGYKDVMKGIKVKLNLEFNRKSDESRFWKAYDELKRQRGGEFGPDGFITSDLVQKMLHEEVTQAKWGERNRKSILDRINKRLDDIYEAKAKLEGISEEDSDAFEESEEFTFDDLPI